MKASVSLSELLEELRLQPDSVVLELNREIVPKEKYASTNLLEGDALEIVHFVGGGEN